MTNVAALGFAIDSHDAVTAASNLEKLTLAAIKTEQSANKLESGAKHIGDALKKTADGAKAAQAPVDQLGKTFGQQDEHVKAFSAELERLTVKYQPLSRATREYDQTIRELDRQHRDGRLNAEQHTAALDKQRIAYERLKTSAAAAGTTMRPANNNYQAAGIAAQLQDVAVSAAYGNPLQVGLQQGFQLGEILKSLRREGEETSGILDGLKDAATSLFDPVALLSIGLTTATVALIQYFSAMDWGGAKSKETLEKEAALIDAVAQQWGAATPALAEYARRRAELADSADLKAAVNVAAVEQYAAAQKQLTEMTASYAAVLADLTDGPGSAFPKLLGELQTNYGTLNQKTKEGTATSLEAEQVQNSLFSLYGKTGIDSVRQLAMGFGDLAKMTGEAADAASRYRDEWTRITISKSLPTLGSLSPLTSADGRFMNPAEMQDWTARNTPSQFDRNPTVLNSDGRTVGVPTPGQKPNAFDSSGVDKQETAYQRLVKSAQRRIAQMQFETSVMGQTGAAVDALRFQQDLLFRAQDDGGAVTARQRSEIEKLAEAYRKAGSAAAQAKFDADMAFQTKLSNMALQDQQVLQSLRRYGLDEDMSGANAGLVRDGLRRQELKESISGFLTDFKSGLIGQGGEAGKSFGDAVKSALLNSVNKWQDAALGAVFGGSHIFDFEQER